MSGEAKLGWSSRKYSWAAALAVLVLVGGLGGWAALAELSGAVIATGEVRVESNRQVVQHPFGGPVGEILARDGDVVTGGDVLLRLDDTRLRAEAAILQGRLDEARARRARLFAERDGADAPIYPNSLKARAAHDEEVAEIIAGQNRLFHARVDTMRQTHDQLRLRITQIEDEIGGLEAQIAAAEVEISIIRQEIDTLEALRKKGLSRLSPVLELRREEARVRREAASYTSGVANARSRIGEIEVSLVRLDAERLEEVITELRDLDAQVAELEDEMIKVADELARTELRAPVGGVVHASTVHTLGAVIEPAAPVLFIVPTEERLIVEAQVEPASIDQLYPGQPAVVRFPAFNSRTTPDVHGNVQKVSADRMVDEAQGISYYVVEIGVSDEELAKLEGLTLVPGMPTETHIRTEDRTPISYLLKPLTDNFQRAMREE